jgi:hypothetical protein
MSDWRPAAAQAGVKPEAAAALAQAWLAYLAASQARGGMDEPQLVDLAVKVVALQCSNCWHSAGCCSGRAPEVSGRVM